MELQPDHAFLERLERLLKSPHTTPGMLAAALQGRTLQLARARAGGNRTLPEKLAADARLPETVARELLDTVEDIPMDPYQRLILCRGLARNPYASAEMLERLRRLSPLPPEVLRNVCKHPNTSERTLAAAVGSIRSVRPGSGDRVEAILTAICQHPNTADDTLRLIEFLARGHQFRAIPHRSRSDRVAAIAQRAASALPAWRPRSRKTWIPTADAAMMLAASLLTPPGALDEIVDTFTCFLSRPLPPMYETQFCFVVARNPQSSTAAIRKTLTFYADRFGVGVPGSVVAALADRYRAQSRAACRACPAV